MYRYILTWTCLAAAGCGGGAPQPAAEGEPAAAAVAPAVMNGADFRIDAAVVTDDLLHLDGSGTLPDGALISYEIKHDGFDVGDYDGYETGQFPMSGGAFNFEMSVEDWPQGHALIKLTFELQPSGDSQPASVIQAYGADGEGLAGPNVVEFGGRKRITVTGDAEIR